MTVSDIRQSISGRVHTKFDKFLIRCGENESDTIVLSRFRSGLREDLRRELFVREISTLDQAYQLVQDLDHSQDFPFPIIRL